MMIETQGPVDVTKMIIGETVVNVIEVDDMMGEGTRMIEDEIPDEVMIGIERGIAIEDQRIGHKDPIDNHLPPLDNDLVLPFDHWTSVR
jgi:hypothetical protein